MAERPVAVLGGGPAGLGAAWRLARAGRPVVVLEREAGPGGLAASFEVAGVRVDHGSHRLHPSISPRILSDLEGLLGGELQRRPRNGRIRVGGRWLRFPLRAADLALHLPPAMAARAARDLLASPLRRPRAATYAEVVRAAFGPTLAEAVYFPFARKLWGRDPEHLAAEQAHRRIAAGSLAAVLGRALRPGARRTFLYPAGGFGALSEALAAGAVAAGADVRYGRTVREVALAADRATVRAETAGGTEVVEAAAVWSTLPLPVLVRLARPAVPPAVDGAASGLRWRAVILVYLAVAADRYTPFETHYLPDEATPVSRLSEPKGYRSSPRDPAGRTVLCAELPCDRGGELWRAGERDLATVVGEALARTGLPPAVPEAVVVRRLPRVYPVYEPGTAEAFAVLDRWAAGHRRLLTFGRQGLFAHDNTHHALAMAWAAADAARPDGTVDPQRWAAARARFAHHVVED